jgi:hypothetical protein
MVPYVSKVADNQNGPDGWSDVRRTRWKAVAFQPPEAEVMWMVSKLVVLGKEFEIPEMPEEDVRANLLSIVRELDPDVASELENASYAVRVEGEALVVYRTGAVFG